MVVAVRAFLSPVPPAPRGGLLRAALRPRSNIGATITVTALIAVAALTQGCTGPQASGDVQVFAQEVDAAPVPTHTAPSEEAMGWLEHRFEVPDGPRCADDSAYRVFSRPAPSPAPTDALLMLGGGGACWNALTCSAGTASLKAYPPGTTGAQADEQLLAAHTTVFAPSCDGSLFIGSRDVYYAAPGLGLTRHRGWKNAAAAVAQLRRLQPDPHRVVVLGASAGGVGSLAVVQLVLAAFPYSDVVLVSDSGPGFFGPNAIQLREMKNSWWMGRAIPDDCTRCDPDMLPLVDLLLSRHPRLRRVGLLSFDQDRVIRGFLMMSGRQFKDRLTDVFGDLARRHPTRVRRYLARGDDHVVLDAPYVKPLRDGVTPRAWLHALLQEDGPLPDDFH